STPFSWRESGAKSEYPCDEGKCRCSCCATAYSEYESVKIGSILEDAYSSLTSVMLRSCATLHNVFTRDISMTLLHRTANNEADAVSTEIQRAREIATFIRFRENRNSTPRGMCSPLDAAIEISTTAASCP